MSIEDHKFDDDDVAEVIVGSDFVTFDFDGATPPSLVITKDDAYALAKHFGLIDEWVSVHDKKPTYGQPVLLRINGVVQTVTYNLDGSDDSLDWFEPYSNIGVYDDYNELSFFVEHDVDVEWQPLPQPPKETTK